MPGCREIVTGEPFILEEAFFSVADGLSVSGQV